MTQLAPHVQDLVESICEQGCQQVNQVIDDIEKGAEPETPLPLANHEKKQLVTELKAIMSVYDTKHET